MGRENLGGMGKGANMIKIYCMKNFFSIKKKKSTLAEAKLKTTGMVLLHTHCTFYRMPREPTVMLEELKCTFCSLVAMIV